MYDPVEQLGFTSALHPVRGAFPTAILGNVENQDFELIQLLFDLPSGLAEMAAARKLSFVGFVGIVNGIPKSAFEVPLDDASIAIVSAAYLKIIEAGMDARLEIAMLERMWAKPGQYDA